jgi:hypothetical protein
VVCGEPNVDLHHLDYARLGAEEYGDLIPACRVHHDRIHAARDATTPKKGNPDVERSRGRRTPVDCRPLL